MRCRPQAGVRRETNPGRPASAIRERPNALLERTSPPPTPSPLKPKSTPSYAGPLQIVRGPASQGAGLSRGSNDGHRHRRSHPELRRNLYRTFEDFSECKGQPQQRQRQTVAARRSVIPKRSESFYANRPSDGRGPGIDPRPPCAFKVSMFNVFCNSH